MTELYGIHLNHQSGLPRGVNVDTAHLTEVINHNWPTDWPPATSAQVRSAAGNGGVLVIVAVPQGVSQWPRPGHGILVRADEIPDLAGRDIVGFATFAAAGSCLTLERVEVEAAHEQATAAWPALVTLARNTAKSTGLTEVAYGGDDPNVWPNLIAAGMRESRAHIQRLVVAVVEPLAG